MFEWITGVIERLGYTGVAVLTFLENLFPPIPSEVIIPLAGFVAAQGQLRLDVVIVAGTAGSLMGSALWYVVGRRVGEHRLRRWIERSGKWLTLSPNDLDRADGSLCIAYRSPRQPHARWPSMLCFTPPIRTALRTRKRCSCPGRAAFHRDEG
jgi:hypothetical protein